MTGDYPGNARKGQVALTVEPSEPETATMALVEANENGGEADPSAIRPALAQLAAVNLDALQRALLDAALSATTTRWATVTCSGCQTRSRVELPMPDVKARLQAIQLLLSESLGKAPIAAELASPQMPTNVAAVKTMDWETMQQVFATPYVDELAVAAGEGGHALLREKLNTLSEGEQRVLREALAETAA